jgi:hypothetical protein
MFARTRLTLVILGALGVLGAYGCDGCGRRAARKDTERVAEPAERERTCKAAADCGARQPCTKLECVDERCVVSLAPKGTSCDNDTVCDGVSTCDANGRCLDGPPPIVDDGNACTTDSCDAKRGAVHEAVPIDDFDACTTDSCDPATGAIAHTTISVDDGNDCTADSCDPRTGVKHVQPDPVYTCEASCEHGFHVASRSKSPQCGSAESLRSFCAPNCGASFYTCEASCPNGYARRAVSPGGSCGTEPSIMLFCAKG